MATATEILNQIFTKNAANGVTAINVNAQGIESSYSEVIEESKTDYEIISPTQGNYLIIHDVFLLSQGNIGEVKLDFNDNGDPIARLYSSRFDRLILTNMTLKGDVDQAIKLNGGDSEDDLFVLINYVEVDPND